MPTPAIEWTTEDSLAAAQEGWNIWDCDGSESGPWQICRYDDAELASFDLDLEIPQLGSDMCAWRHVWNLAHAESPLHTKAIMYVREYNGEEYEYIKHWCENHDVSEDQDGECLHRRTEAA